MLLSESFENILKLQSALTHIKTLTCLELPVLEKNMASHSEGICYIFHSIFFFLNQTNSITYKTAGWFYELLQILLIFCLFSCTGLANTSSISSILDKQWWKNALRSRMIVQCHWWHRELQFKFVFFLLSFIFWMGVYGHLYCF